MPSPNLTGRSALAATLLLSSLIPIPAAVAAPLPAGQPHRQQAQQRPPAADAAHREIESLYQQGVSAIQKRDYALAEQCFQAAYKRAEALGEPYTMGSMLDGLSGVFEERGDLEMAIKINTRAVELVRQSGRKGDLAQIMMNLAGVYGRAGQFTTAIRITNESLGIWNELKDPKKGASALGLLANLYQESGQFTKAIAAFQEEIRIQDSINAGPASLSGTHSDLGNAYKATAQFDLARKEYDLAMRFAQAANDPLLYASALNNYAVALESQGRFPEALNAFNQSLQMREKGSDPNLVAKSLINIAALAYRWGRYDMTILYARRSLAITEQNGSKNLMGIAYNTLGVAQDELGQKPAAEESLLRSVAIYDAMGDPDGAASAIYNLGGICAALRQYPQAVKMYNRALETAQKHGDYHFMAQVLRSLAIVQGESEHLDAALESFQQVNAIVLKLNSPQDLANSYADLGVTYYKLNRDDEAIKALTDSLALRKKVGGDLRAVANAQGNLATIYEAKGNWEKSVELLQEAETTLETLRDQVAAPSDIGALQNDVGGSGRDIYTIYALALMHLNRNEEALLQIERGRGQGLARQAAEPRQAWTGLLPIGDANRMLEAVQTLRQAETNLRSAETQAAREGGNDDDTIVISKQVDEARRIRDESQLKLTTLRNELASRVPAYRALCGMDAPTMSTYTDLAKANPDTLYLTWAVGSNGESILFALRADTGLKAFSLPFGQKTLQKQVDDWRDAITPAEQDPTNQSKGEKELDSARALYATLLAPIEKAGLLNDGKTKRLVVIGDGALRELPFAALVDPNGKRLVERFPISTGISLRLLAPGSRGGTMPPPGRGFLCVADPGGGGGSSRATGRSGVLDGFAPLPAARREGQAISQLFNGGATLLIGNDATKEAVLQKLETARLLHFATHGYLDEDSGLKSGLLIAPKLIAGADGQPELAEMPLLTGDEILQHTLSAEMVTLSACETGRGEKGGGEGLVGLVWAFQASGCSSVVASQWSVDDDATGRLMVKLYEGLKAGLRRDEALRQAMLSIRGDGTGRKSAPFYWAAFELHGDAAPLRH